MDITAKLKEMLDRVVMKGSADKHAMTEVAGILWGLGSTNWQD